MFLKAPAMESAIFSEMEEECKVSCVKLVVWSTVAQRGTKVLIFYVFEYEAEYGAECSVKSDAKQYFMIFSFFTNFFDLMKNCIF